MNTTQSARLVLKTHMSNSVNSSITKYTFSGINLRTILGDMYDKYDTFNLCLKSIGSEYIDTTSDLQDLSGASLDELAIIIKIKGLPFINQTYTWSSATDSRINLNTDTAILTTVYLKKGDSLQEYFMNNQLTFSKYQQLCDLTFEYETIKNVNGLPITNFFFPEMCYIFDIYGVGEPKDVNKIMAQRFLIG